MKPWLWAALCVTLAATAMLAVRPEPAEVVQPAQLRPPLQPASKAAAWAEGSEETHGQRSRSALPAPRNAAMREPWPQASEAALAAWSAAPPPLPNSPNTPSAARSTRPATPLAQLASAAASTSPPLAPQPVPATPPPVPPFGYTLIGVLQQDGVYTALLDSKHKSLVARRDDRIDGQWQVVAVAPEGLDLIWLPQQKPMRIGFAAP